MTDERMALIELIELIEKQADTDLVREMLAFAADRIMELEVALRTGATMAVAMSSPMASTVISSWITSFFLPSWPISASSFLSLRIREHCGQGL